MKKTRRKSKSTKDQITWMLVGAGAAMLAGTLIERSMTVGWRAVKSEDPPVRPEAVDTDLSDALVWTAVTAVAIGLGQILAKRGAAIGWRAYTGKLPPG
jgi:Protein of unknown function (DUF4235)